MKDKNFLGLTYAIDETPPWYLGLALGFQVSPSEIIYHSKPNTT